MFLYDDHHSPPAWSKNCGSFAIFLSSSTDPFVNTAPAANNARNLHLWVTCSDQGIQAGWADVYGAHLDCQWIDVTDVPAGIYTLEIEVNPA